MSGLTKMKYFFLFLVGYLLSINQVAMAFYWEEVLPGSTGRVYLALSAYEGELCIQEQINADWLIENRAKAICFEKGYDGLYSFNHTKLTWEALEYLGIDSETFNKRMLFDILAPVNYEDYFDALGVFARAAFRSHRYTYLRIAVKQQTWIFDSIQCFWKEDGIPLQNLSPKDTQNRTEREVSFPN